MATVDVTVMGAGIFGLSIAYVCLRRGARVRLIEKRRVGAGSSGGVVGALAPHVPENWNEKKAFQFDSLMMAAPFWDGVQAVSGQSAGYARTGRLQGIADDHALELARGRCVTAGMLWQGRAVWEVVRGTGGWEPPSATGWLIRDTLSARLHPGQACAALAGAVLALGGEIVFGEAPGVGQVIWATGYEGLEDLSRDLGRPVGTGIKGQAVLLKHEARLRPQLFVDGLHIVPHGDGTVAIGSTTEREFETPDAVDAQVDGLLEHACAALPLLHGATEVGRWAGVRPRARSRAPILGEWPGRAGQYVANGGFKIGFGMAPKVAEVMADLVLEGRDAIPDGFQMSANL